MIGSRDVHRRSSTGHMYIFDVHIHNRDIERCNSRLRLICIGRAAEVRSAAVHRPFRSSLAVSNGSRPLVSRGCSQEGAQHRGVTARRADIRVYTHPHRVAGSSNGGSRDLWPQREVARRRLIYFTVGGRPPIHLPRLSSTVRRAPTLSLFLYPALASPLGLASL